MNELLHDQVAGGLDRPLEDEGWSEQEVKTVGKRSITVRRKEGKVFFSNLYHWQTRGLGLSQRR